MTMCRYIREFLCFWLIVGALFIIGSNLKADPVYFKSDVKVSQLYTETLKGIVITEGVFRKFGYRFTITSLQDGVRGRGSLHSKGLAFDVRIWGISRTRQRKIKKELEVELGGRYDVILEKDHIHIEVDPE